MKLNPWLGLVVGVALGAFAAAGLAQDRAASAATTGDELRHERDVEYGTGSGHSLRLDLVRRKTTKTRAAPAIVYVHGGAWEGGSKSQLPPLALRFARRGYVVASVEYRFSREAIFPAQIEDCKCAIRFLRAHAADYGIAPDHIGVWGSSAGGHLVALLGTAGEVKELEGTGGWSSQSSRVQAVVDFFGPADLVTFPDDVAESALASDVRKKNGWGPANSPETRLLGGPVAERMETARRASPVTHASRTSPPFLILHGDRDPLVPLRQSQRLEEALRNAGAEVKLHVVEGAGHGFGGPRIDEMVTQFFEKHLGPPPE